MNLARPFSTLFLLFLMSFTSVCHAEDHILSLLTDDLRKELSVNNWRINFDQHRTGEYSTRELNSDWKNPEWVMGRNLISVVDGKEAYSGKSIKFKYLKGKSSCENAHDCIHWYTDLDKKVDTIYFGFRIKFSKDFDFVWGGKLPGLAGGNGNSGGDIPNGKDGWSLRVMWNDENKFVSYVYHPDQVWAYGDVFPFDMSDEKNGQIETDKWYTLQIRLQLNTPGKKDGSITGWLNGKKALVKKRLRFRDINDLEIDRFDFVSFFGGHGPKWAPKVDQTAYLDDFRVSQNPPFFRD